MYLRSNLLIPLSLNRDKNVEYYEKYLVLWNVGNVFVSVLSEFVSEDVRV